MVNELYEKILKTTKAIKTNLMLELADDISLSGGLPNEALQELDNLANIEGLTIGMLHKRGEELKEVVNKKDCVSIEVNGNVYTTHLSKLPSFVTSFFSEEKKMIEPETVPEKKSEQVEEKQQEPVMPQEPIIEETESFENFKSFPFEEEETTEEILNIEEDSPSFVEEKEEEEEPFHFSTEVETETETIQDMEVSGEPQIEESQEKIPQIEEPLKATIIGGDFISEPIVAPMSRADMFVEEKRKLANEFVYDYYRASVCHVGSQHEEMQIMIAPLKIQKYSCPTVPIIVSIYYKNKLYVASSFDKNKDGQNIVLIDVNEYYFLCRGFFNDKGEFQSTVNTTGISANQGDMINIVSHKHYAPTGSAVKNGHLKFRYTGEEGPGIIEIFPLEPVELGKKDFVMMTRCGEFVEYIPISNSAHGLSRAILYDDGMKSEVVCMWDGDYLEAEIVPV